MARRTSTTGTFALCATAWAISYSRRGEPSRIRSRIGCHRSNSRRIFLPAVFNWCDGHFRRPQSRRSAFSNTAYPKLRGCRSSARARINCLRLRFIQRQARTGQGIWTCNRIYRDAIEDLQSEQNPQGRLTPRGLKQPQVTAVDPDDIRHVSLGKSGAFSVCPEIGWEKLGGQSSELYYAINLMIRQTG